VSEFHLDLVAAKGDVDDLNHISNVAYVRWVQEVARAHSHASGWSMPEYQKLGAVWVVRRHDIEYLAPAFAGDAIRLETWVESWQAASATRRTRISRVAGGAAAELARATTIWVLVSTDGGRPRRIPPEMRAAFENPR
jgi:acyl-CoA thioester hydrolase